MIVLTRNALRGNALRAFSLAELLVVLVIIGILVLVAMPNLMPRIVGSISDDIGLSDHHREWYEVWSNQMSYNYFDRHNETAITSNWSTNNPRKQHIDWFFYTTMVYYASLFRWPFIFIF